MPTAAKNVCRQTGCGRLCEGSHCDQHKRCAGMSDARRERRKNFDKARGSAFARGYAPCGRWSKLRAAVLSRDPLCQLRILCDGMEPSEQVDHKIPRERGGDDSLENLQGACASCHSYKTAMFDSSFVASRGKPKALSVSQVKQDKRAWD